MTVVYTLAHFAVDLACAFVMFSGDGMAVGFLLYNFFAFAVQMPLGVLVDRFGGSRWFSLGGIALVFLTCCVPVLGPCVLGLGNALFHIGGGAAVMERYENRAAELGIFVSSGALGLYYGRVLAKKWPVLALLGTVFALICLLKDKKEGKNPQNFHRSTIPAAVCLFLVVVLRSFGGMAVDFPWEAGVWATVVVVLGKAVGGILADRFGSLATAAVSLTLAAVCFALGGNRLFGLAGLLCFNMTMPITLFELSRRMPGSRGFAFGLLTFGLFLGFLPIWLGAGHIRPLAMAGVAAGSLALLLPGSGTNLKEISARNG